MSRLEELIQKYCPDGVEYKSLGEVCDIHKGVQFNKSDMADEGTYPVINGGISPSGYVEVFNELENTITISQGGASAGYVNFLLSKFWLGAHCYAVKPYNVVLNRYLYHFIKQNELYLQQCQYGAGIPALAKGTIASLEIPVPPLPVQEEIVRILDTFTELQTELETELEKRLQQYQHYLNVLLQPQEGYFSQPLSELCSLITKQTGFDYAATIKPSLVRNNKGDVCPFIQNKDFSGIKFNYNTDYYIPLSVVKKYPKITLSHPCLLFSISGAIGNVGLYLDNKLAFIGGAIAICHLIEGAINYKYLLYYLLSYYGQSQIKGAVKAASHANVTVESIRKIIIKFPSIQEQERIVSILDKFDTLINDLKTGLPAEIEKRRQQYEFYRDKLLTFKRKEA